MCVCVCVIECEEVGGRVKDSEHKGEKEYERLRKSEMVRESERE